MKGKARALGWATVIVVVVGGTFLIVKASLPELETAPRNNEPAEPEGPPPRLVIEAQEGVIIEGGRAAYDFGAMAVGRESSHTFILRNEGEGPLVLTAGQPTCECTDFTIPTGEERTVLPGERIELTLDWHVTSPAAEFRHGVDLRTNDPELRRLQLGVQGAVHRITAVRPERVTMQGVTSVQTVEREVRYLTQVADSLTITSVETSRPEITVDFEPASPEILEAEGARAGYVIRVTLQPGMAIGRHQEWIEVAAQVGEESLRQEVDVDISVHGPVTIRGEGYDPELNSVTLGNIARGSSARRELSMWVRGGQGSAAQWEVLETRPDYVRASVERRSGSAAGSATPYILTIEVPSDAPPGTYMGSDLDPTGSIRLGSNIPGAEELVIGVRFSVGG